MYLSTIISMNPLSFLGSSNGILNYYFFVCFFDKILQAKGITPDGKAAWFGVTFCSIYCLHMFYKKDNTQRVSTDLV